MDDPFKRPANSKKRVLEPTATNTKRIKVDRPEKERLLDEDYIRKWTRAFKNIVLYFDKPPENSIKDEIVLLSTRLGAVGVYEASQEVADRNGCSASRTSSATR